MASSEIAVPVDFLLARDELLYVLNLLAVATIPGLEDDPAGAMTPGEQTVALRVAGRGLRARQLASVREDGEVVLQNNLLAAIATCAIGQRAIFVNHWAANQTLPMPIFAHIGDNGSVIHTRPADVLHSFSLQSSVADLVQQILDICEVSDQSASGAIALKLPATLLPQVREKAEAGAKAEAVNLLVANGNSAEAAQALVDTLATPYRASSLQLAQQANGQTTHQDMLLLQDDRQRWLITGATADSVTIQTVTRAEIQELLAKWLAS